MVSPTSKATLPAIEHELDTRWARVRARMLEDLALVSAATNWAATPADQQPTCPDCGQPLHLRGADTRTLQTQGGEALTLERHYGSCPALWCWAFPLDEELGLLPGSFTLRLQEALV